MARYGLNENDPGAGGHRNKGPNSLASIGSTFVITVIPAIAYLVAFLVVRSRYRNIYAPRTYFRTIPEKSRTPATTPNTTKWYRDFFSIDDKFILRHNSLEAFLFLRFFRVIIVICFVGCLLTWPILLPVNINGGGDGNQLNRLTFSNVTDSKKLYAHAVVMWLFVVFVLLLITRERMFLISLKQAYLTTKSQAQRLSSRTVLFLTVPPPALIDKNLHRYFGPNAKRTWKVSDLGDLESLVDKRNDKVYTLEQAEITLAKNVNASEKSDQHNENNDTEEARPLIDPEDPSVRPKSKTIPLVGKQVDTLDYHLHKIPEIVEDIQKKREMISSTGPKSHGAIFVEFEDQLSAFQAYQSVRHHSPLALQPRYIGIEPKEVLWSNLMMGPTRRIFFSYLVVALFTATIIFWSIPVGIIGTISNIKALAEDVPALSFINKLPSPILGALQGFLPPFLLSQLISYVPKFFRYVNRIGGAATTVDAEEKTQQWYFAFQLIQVFLVTTLTSGAAAVVLKIFDDPKSFPKLLGDNLPSSSNFYLTYFLLQGTSSAANNLFNYSDLLEYIFFDKFFDKTPRQKYDRMAFMRGCPWGTWYPKFTNFVVIAIVYSCIAPLVLGFTTIGLFFFYLSYRYSLLYTRQVKVETRGDSYARALQHMMTGVYLLELCMFGLFSTRKAEGPGVMTIVLLIGTVIYHVTINKFLTPLEDNVPMDVLTEGEEEEPTVADEAGYVEHRDDFHGKSLLQRIAGGNVPTILLDPLASVLEPRLLTSHDALRPWLSDEWSGSDVPPEYTEEEMNNAYLHPAMTSKTPKIWLARDQNNISKWEMEKNEAAGLTSSDEGAELDENNEVKWNQDDLSTAPIFKAPKTY